MKVAVVGAGAVGALLGGLLADAGEDVTLIGRPAHVRAIQSGGLRLGGVVGERVVRVKARESLAEEPDLTILTVKTQDLAEACRAVAPVVGHGIVLTTQNGLRADDIAGRFFDPARIVGCVVFAMATFLEPGEVNCQVRGWLTIGDPFVSQPSRLELLKDTLQKALPVRISRDIAATRRTKLIGNLNNALPAVTGLPLQQIYFSPTTSRLPLRMMREGLDVFAKSGVSTDRSPQSLAMRGATRLPEAIPLSLFRLLGRTRLGGLPMFGSTWQSIKRGSSTEIDHLNGEIVTLGEQAGHPTPYNSRMVQLVHQVRETGEFYPPEKLWPVTA